MSTEHLTPEEIIEKKYLLQRLCQNTKWRLRDAMEEYAAQQVEQQTKQLKEELEKSQNSNSVLGEGWHRLNEENKQLKEERDRAIWIIKQANSILNHSSYYILQKSPFARWVKDFLNQLNQNNEG